MMSMQLVTELGVVDVDHLRWTEALVKKQFMIFLPIPSLMKNEVLVKRGLSCGIFVNVVVVFFVCKQCPAFRGCARMKMVIGRWKTHCSNLI